jgi:transposase
MRWRFWQLDRFKKSIQKSSKKSSLRKLGICFILAILEEANKIIKTLWDVIQKLSEKLKINSKNSSLSPSKDRSSKNKSNIKRTEERKKNPKKQGGQPGHQKHERTLLPLDKVNQVVECCPDKQCACGGRILINKETYRRHQQYEFPVIRPFVTGYQIYDGTCKQC